MPANDLGKGFIPFKPKGDLEKFESAYLLDVSLLNLDSREVSTNLLSSIWSFGQREFGRGHAQGQDVTVKSIKLNLPESGSRKLVYCLDITPERIKLIEEITQREVDKPGASPKSIFEYVRDNIADITLPEWTAFIYALAWFEAKNFVK